MGIRLIGERINQSRTKIKDALSSRNIEYLVKVARNQEKEGADYLDINIGTEPKEVMQEVVRAVKSAVNIPLCFDSDDTQKLEAALGAYSPSSLVPILNSATESRASGVFSLGRDVIVLLSERMDNGRIARNSSVSDIIRTADRMLVQARKYDVKNIYFDPGTFPIAADMEGESKKTLDAITQLRAEYPQCHISLGLSNFSSGMPPEIRNGLENAYLRMAIERGLDTVICDPSKKYVLDTPSAMYSLLEDILNTQNADERLLKIAGLCSR